ncbi:MAG: YcbK family protein, partial [Polyangiaceae bacterium]
GLAARLEQVVAHFTKDGKTPRLSVVSGYRPASVGSFHASGKALDFHIEGVSNEALVAFCKTLQDTGCGYYPNSSFVHMDVRPTGTGHVQWIDASGPGESPHYVSAWPPPPEPLGPNGQPIPATDLPPLPIDEHPADPGFVTRPVEIPFDQGNGPSDFEAKNGEPDPAL